MENENIVLTNDGVLELPFATAKRQEMKKEHIMFSFPNGFTKLRLIEECRALNCMDFSNMDNFDFMYDITMQMLAEKVVVISYKEKGKITEIARFIVTNRYMDLRSVPIIDKYPIIVNWLVDFISVELAKKVPLSLKDLAPNESIKNDGHLKKQKK